MTEEETFEALQLRIVVDEHGAKRYYNNENQYHRIFGPAVISADGSEYWYQNGKIHREDGPAVEYADGEKFWFLNDKRHRTDGHAIEYSDGDKFWYINDHQFTEAEFLKHPLCTIK